VFCETSPVRTPEESPLHARPQWHHQPEQIVDLLVAMTSGLDAQKIRQVRDFAE
jgi:hypothetical protein